MVRAPYFDKDGVKKGAWSESEDQQLRSYIEKNGYSNWRKLPKLAGLSRCGKSCRLRWMNYLDPTINRGNYTDKEEALIISLHRTLGNKWSKIAAELPGRSDNDVKNHWHTHLRKRVITPNSPIRVSNSGHELVPSPKCSTKEKCVLEGSDLKDRDEVELLITVLSSDQSSYDANNEQQSPSSWSSSLDQVGWNSYSPEVVSNEEPVNDYWSIMGDDIFMEHMDLMVGNYDGSLTSGHDTIMIGDCLWQSVQFCGNDTCGDDVRRWSE